MGTIAEKLQAALDSKNAIKNALIAKEMNPSDVFSEYAELIENMGSGITFFPDGLGTFYFQDTDEPRKVFYTEQVLRPASPEIVAESSANLTVMKKDELFYTGNKLTGQTTVTDFDGNEVDVIGTTAIGDIDLEGNYYKINGYYVEKYNKDEELIWSCNLEGKLPWKDDYSEAPTLVRVGTDGAVYVATSVSSVIKISKVGAFLWLADMMSYVGTGSSSNVIKISPNNNYVFIYGPNMRVFEISASGNIKWSFLVGQYGSFGISNDALYVLQSRSISEAKTIYKIPMDSTDGTSTASYTFETVQVTTTSGSIQCDANPKTGYCYIMSVDGNLYKFDSDLNLVWSFVIYNGTITTAKVVCGEEFVYAYTSPNNGSQIATKKIKESDLSYWIAHFE